MKKIAVICALPPERNTGMVTVDLAALATLKRLYPDASVTFYTYGSPNQYTYQKGELPHSYVDIRQNAEPFFASDIFLFWGDFIHSHAYIRLDRFSWDEKTVALTEAEKKAHEERLQSDYFRHIFLSDLPLERLATVTIFGSTIISNDAISDIDALYKSHFTRLFANAGDVLFRDALSAAKISPLRKNDATLACDCAFLLRDDDRAMLENYKKPETRDGIGVFFGRSPGLMHMLTFSRILARTLNVKASWLPWFHTRRLHRYLAKMLGYTIGPQQPSPGAILSQLQGYKFIVTDTYHLCVNAWNMGIPAICIGEGSRSITDSLGDKKKEVLYKMYGARPFYVFTESLKGFGRYKAIVQAAAALNNEELCTAVIANIADHRTMAEQRLAAALNKAMGQ